MTTRVVNLHTDPFAKHAHGFRLIDRRTVWGNPFKIGRDGTREEVIAKYRTRILARTDLLARLPELKGKTLGCWCKPLPCHGDVLVELVEALP
jgi:hypothetical protein